MQCSASPSQQRRPLPSPLSFSFFYVWVQSDISSLSPKYSAASVTSSYGPKGLFLKLLPPPPPQLEAPFPKQDSPVTNFCPVSPRWGGKVQFILSVPLYTEKKTIPEFFRQSFYITKVSEGSCLFVRKICTAYTVHIHWYSLCILYYL